MTLSAKIKTAFSTSVIMMTASIVPALAFNDVSISGNGAGSLNEVLVTEECTSIIAQENNTTVEVVADVDSKSGGNSASGNVDSDVEIKAGGAASVVSIDVEGGDNIVKNGGCCECSEDLNFVELKRNGFRSFNTTVLASSTQTLTEQNSETEVGVLSQVDSKSGKNRANYNTGSDSAIKVSSGHSFSSFTLKVKQGINLIGSFGYH